MSGLNPTRRLMHGELGFRGYCKALAKGTTVLAHDAKLLLNLKAETAIRAASECEKKLVDQEITETQYRLYMDAIENVTEAYNKGVQTFRVDTKNPMDWQNLGDGCHRRINHLRSSN